MENETKNVDLLELLENIKVIENTAKTSIHDLHVIMNYLIKQLDIFDKLSEKYPNILTFRTAIVESEEVVEKIILIQEENQKLLEKIKTVYETVENQNNFCKILQKRLDVLRAMSEHFMAVFEPKNTKKSQNLNEFQSISKNL